MTIKLPDKETAIPGISLAAGEEAVLPFEMEVEGFHLNYARVQPLSVIREDGRSICFFFAPEGMSPVYVWDGKNIETVDGRQTEGPVVTVTPDPDQMSSYCLTGGNRTVEIVTLTREQSLMFYETEVKGRKTAVLCSSPFFCDGTDFHVESLPGKQETTLLAYPSCEFKEMTGGFPVEPYEEGSFKGVRLFWDKDRIKEQVLDIEPCGPYRYVVQIPEAYKDCKDALMQVDYIGDIGHAFVDGELIADNFSNRVIWEIGLKEALKAGMGFEITFVITPLKKSVKVDVSSTMAGRMETEGESAGELKAVSIQPVLEAVIAVQA